MSTNQRLFYNRFKYRIRFSLRRGASLMRSCYHYKDDLEVLNTLDRMRNTELEYANTSQGFFTKGGNWVLDEKEVEHLLSIYAFRQNFDPQGKVRVECPIVDFYSNSEDYVKRAEDTGIQNVEITRSLTEDPNVIVTDKLPYGVYKLKCITRYSWVQEDVIDALLNYQMSGEIRMPWTWETRRMYNYGHPLKEKPLPEYIYAKDNDSILMLNLIAGDVINTIYTYRIA